MTGPDVDLKPRLERLGDRVQPRTDAFERLDRARAKRSRARRAGTIVLALIVAVAGSWGALAVLRAQGDGTPAGHPPSTGPTAALGTTVCDGITASRAQIRLRNVSWDIDCWAAPRGEPLIIRYIVKDDGVASGLIIEPLDSCEGRSLLTGTPTDCSSPTDALFQGQLVTGPGAITYDVGPLPTGAYVVYDPVHPVSAHATLIVT